MNHHFIGRTIALKIEYLMQAKIENPIVPLCKNAERDICFCSGDKFRTFIDQENGGRE